MLDVKKIKEAVFKRIENSLFGDSEEESNLEKERLKRDMLCLINNDNYVFDKFFEADDGSVVEIAYYQYSVDIPDEEYFNHIYEYHHYFMEVHGIYPGEVKEDGEKEYKERVIIYANNNCDRMCCGTWEFFNETIVI